MNQVQQGKESLKYNIIQSDIKAKLLFFQVVNNDYYVFEIVLKGE
jgi:hypothetical protein